MPLEGEPEEAIDAADVDRQGRGFWIRLAAALIDGLLLMIVLGIAISLLWDAEDIARSVMLGEDGEHWTMIETFGTLLPLAYFTGPVALWGATVGKAVLGMRIVRADGGRVGWGRALARCLAWLLSWLLLAAGHIMIASRRDKRGLHDLIAGTRVIRSRGRG
ncbi:MAG: RDD family protein [Chloroflexota bacterium]